jgi:hypothetical protein
LSHSSILVPCRSFDHFLKVLLFTQKLTLSDRELNHMFSTE